MELAAVVVVPNGEDLRAIHAAHSRFSEDSNSRLPYSSRMLILGNDVLRSWMERIRKLGVPRLWLTSSPSPFNLGEESAACSDLAGLARQGVERLLMIKLKAYAELDLADLLRFHCESRNSVTEANDAQGQLGISLLDHLALHAADQKCESSCAPSVRVRTVSGRTPYRFHGYAKRMSGRERQELVGDVLTGVCEMRPSGTQIREQVWIGEGANLAESVRVIGPTYIGARTIVRAGATIGPFASVERDCIVDCGTTVERSTVLPHSYLAPGLLIRHALVDGGCLEDLDSGTIADLQPAGLGSRIRRRESHREYKHSWSDASSRTENRWSFSPSPAATHPWLQVQL